MSLARILQQNERPSRLFAAIAAGNSRAEQTTRDQATAVSSTLAHLTAVIITGLKPGRESDYGYYSHAYYDDR